MNPQPQQMLPPQAVAAMVRRGASPNGLFQQAPMQAGATPGAPTYDPSMATPPQAGTQQQNPMMTPPPGTTPGQPMQPGQPQLAGQSGDVQPMSESQMILNALQDRLEHHSKITEKTLSTLTKMLEANIPVDPSQQSTPTSQ